MVNAHLRATARGRGSAGRASPCQGEGRGFESRRPLGRRPGNRPDFLGGVAERRGNGLQIRVRGFKSRRHLETLLGPLAQWLARFLDTEEVTGSIPVWSTKNPYFTGKFDPRPVLVAALATRQDAQSQRPRHSPAASIFRPILRR